MKNIAFFPLASLLALAPVPHAWAQASCSSDGVARPTALFERFINADCEACWSDTKAPAPSADAAVTVLDWIVPSPAADEAPLSAAATHDAEVRLRDLGRPLPSTTDTHIAAVHAPSMARLRVAHGLAFNDYLGTAIAFTPPGPAHGQNAPNPRWTYHLLLVETVAPNTEGTAVPRQIVRNMLQGTWEPQGSRPPGKAPAAWREARPMRVADGAKTEHLRVVGWVQDDTSGRIVAAAQSVCR